MKVKDLINEWESKAGEKLTVKEYNLKLPLHDAARLEALANMYPGRTLTQIATELLSAALDELEEAFPYIQGNHVIANDDYGDPIYDDAGPTSKFIGLTKRFNDILKAEKDQS